MRCVIQPGWQSLSGYAIVKMSICRLTFTVGHYYGMSPEHNFQIFFHFHVKASCLHNSKLRKMSVSEFLQFHFFNWLLLGLLIFAENYGLPLSKQEILVERQKLQP